MRESDLFERRAAGAVDDWEALPRRRIPPGLDIAGVALGARLVSADRSGALLEW